MKVAQIYEIVNQITKEVLGEGTEDAPALTVAEDLSNVVEVGKALFDVTSVDNYVRKLINHIGRVVFVNRPYSGRAPSVLMEGWEYGSVMEKIDAGLPTAESNPKWNLQNGQVYEQDKFQGPNDVVAKFFNDRTTFQVFFSFADDQVKESFSNAQQLNGFFSMIYTKIDMEFTIATDGLIMATIDNFIANVYNSASKTQKVNLLAMYKKQFPTATVTAANCMTDPMFLKFAALQFKLYSKRLINASTLFNLGGRVRHTPVDLQKIIMLDEFASAADVYLQSDTFHDTFTELPNADKVSFWQGSGEDFAFENTSKIHVIPNTESGKGAETTITGVLGVIFDREALGVNNFNKRVTNHYNAPGEFVNNWYKQDAQYFNDFNENFILFYVEDPASDNS